ncbi:MAG: ClbS/DfsB family four-helix bundle protein, partial [Chloroflexota bacterium]
LAWHQMVLVWHRAGKRGEVPVTPSEKYTWREIPSLNQEIYETHRDWPLDRVNADFTASHQEIMQEIESLSHDELFTPKVYVWTKSTTLGSYFISATGSHYDWAYKEIRRGIKAKRKQQV